MELNRKTEPIQWKLSAELNEMIILARILFIEILFHRVDFCKTNSKDYKN